MTEELAVLTGSHYDSSMEKVTEARLVNPTTGELTGESITCQATGQHLVSPSRTFLASGGVLLGVDKQKLACLDEGLTATEWVADDDVVLVQGVGGYGVVLPDGTVESVTKSDGESFVGAATVDLFVENLSAYPRAN